jgi:hypothetical protein
MNAQQAGERETAVIALTPRRRRAYAASRGLAELWSRRSVPHR